MHTRIILIAALIFLTRCENDSQSAEKKDYQNVDPNKTNSDGFLLREFVDEFLSNKRVKSEIITLQCVKSNDSLRFIMFDSYPDLDETVFLGYSSVRSHKICFVGDNIPSGFINIEFNDVPVEVIRKNKEVKNSKKVTIEISEPLTLSICFKGRNLIECPTIGKVE